MWKEAGGEGQASCECLFSWSHSHGVEKINSDCFPTWRFVENKVPVETAVRRLSVVVGPRSAKPRCLDGAGCQEPLLAAKNHRWLPTPLTGPWTVVASTTVELNQILPRSQSLFESPDSTLIKDSINITRNNTTMLSNLMHIFFSKIHTSV